jgi:putative hydrolase of the HAD superfamily
MAHMPLPTADGSGGVELVVFDVGGCFYDDDAFAQAMLRAVRELAGEVDEREFWEAYNTQRQAQSGSQRTAIANRFGLDRKQLSDLSNRYLEYKPSHLYPDALPTLRALSPQYKLGIVANQEERVVEALRRDGLYDFFDVVALARAAGAEKPDPRIWRHALNQAGGGTQPRGARRQPARQRRPSRQAARHADHLGAARRGPIVTHGGAALRGRCGRHQPRPSPRHDRRDERPRPDEGTDRRPESVSAPSRRPAVPAPSELVEAAGSLTLAEARDLAAVLGGGRARPE